MFLAVISLLLLLTGLYVRWRLVAPLPLGPSLKGLLAGVFWVLLAMAPLGVALRRQWPPAFWGQWAPVIGYPVLGWLSLIFCLLVLRDGLLAVYRIGEKLTGPIWLLSGRCSEMCDRQGSRRLTLNRTNAALVLLSVALAVWGYFQAIGVPPVKQVSVVIEGLPADLHGLKIVQLTDLHVGATLGRPFVEAVVERVNRLEADMVVITGDLVDGPAALLADDVAPLAGLKARLGKFFVTGNHEYYSGVMDWLAVIRSLGLDVLINDHRLVAFKTSRLLMAGVADLRAAAFFPDHRSDPFKAAAGAPAADVRILLAHQPKSFFEGATAGFDLQISGHTHGGQFYPWTWVVGLFQPFVAGLFHHGPAQLYVSRGTGFWGPPLRLGSPSEITLLRLTGSFLQTP
jgi:hypothetical protein